MVDLISSVHCGYNNINTAQKSTRTSGVAFSLPDDEFKCPYSYMAQDGVINYNGVTFICDYKHNSLTLGDVTSDPRKVLTISLPSGGNLKVNVDNLGDLAKAAGMFTPEDLNAIMRSIETYKHCTEKLDEIEDEENKSPKEISEKPEETSKENSSEEDINLTYGEEVYRRFEYQRRYDNQKLQP